MKEEKVLCVSPYYARENATFYQIHNLGVEKERSYTVRQFQKEICSSTTLSKKENV